MDVEMEVEVYRLTLLMQTIGSMTLATKGPLTILTLGLTVRWCLQQ